MTGRALLRFGLLWALLSRAEAQNTAEGLPTAFAVLAAAPQAGTHGRHLPFPPAVLWLQPLGHMLTTLETPPPSKGGYVLWQKNKMFSPHVLVVPVGASVRFPNRDPFFHDVFSLYEGKRFDLGLYEAGKSKDVVFSREGISYFSAISTLT